MYVFVHENSICIMSVKVIAFLLTSVNLLLSLVRSPHQFHPFPGDKSVQVLYDQINTAWARIVAHEYKPTSSIARAKQLAAQFQERHRSQLSQNRSTARLVETQNRTGPALRQFDANSPVWADIAAPPATLRGLQLRQLYSRLGDVVLVSVSGGPSDLTIRSELASLTGLIRPSHGFSVLTESVPSVWGQADHQVRLQHGCVGGGADI